MPLVSQLEKVAFWPLGGSTTSCYTDYHLVKLTRWVYCIDPKVSPLDLWTETLSTSFVCTVTCSLSPNRSTMTSVCKARKCADITKSIFITSIAYSSTCFCILVWLNIISGLHDSSNGLINYLLNTFMSWFFFHKLLLQWILGNCISEASGKQLPVYSITLESGV